jgi:hypothetical protein
VSPDDRTARTEPPKAKAPNPAPDQPEPVAGPKPEPTIGEAVREQIGGVRGLVESAIPVTVFIVVNMATSLKPAIWSAVGAAIAIAIFRLVRRDSVRHAVNGLFGVGIAALFAARTGTAEGFYLPGIIFSYAEGAAFAVSALIRRPIVGYAWALLTGAHPDWRERPRLVRAYGLITLVWTAAFWTNSSIQLALYFAEMPNALGVARLAGRSLYVAAFAFTIWYGRRAARAEAAATNSAPAPV